MLASLATGFAAGAFSTLSPCVLPLLPIVLTGALQRHPLAPFALAGGLAASFSAIGLFLATLGFALDIAPDRLRMAAALLMAASGLFLVSPRLQAEFGRIIGPVADRANRVSGLLPVDGLIGQFLLGASLGVAWSPCAGPTLGAALGLAGARGTASAGTAVLAAFSLGAVSPLLALAYGSRKAVLSRKDGLARLAHWGKPLLGAGLSAIGLLIVSGFDKTLEAWLTNTMPSWLVALTTRFHRSAGQFNFLGGKHAFFPEIRP